MIAIAGLLTGLTLLLALAIVAIGAGLVAWMALEWTHAKKHVAAVETVVYDGASGREPLGIALRRQAVRQLADGRYLVREHPDATIEAWLDRTILHRLAFEAGGWITGLALIFTFLLIALVLAEDVGPAIQNVKSMGGLSEAVRKMGAKFVVSMLGIGLTIFHGVCRGWFSEDLHERASDASARLAACTVVLADYQAEASERTAEQAARVGGLMHAQHQALSDHMSQLTTSVKSLGSIEVSVQNIGTDLAVKLQNVVKNDIVAGIRKDLEEVTERLCSNLADSFATTVQEQLKVVTAELQKIEAAVAGQAHGQVEELLNKLGDAVSGGFTTESSRMKEALSRFVEVVPLLEQQMRSLIDNAGNDLARRGAESARVSEALVTQLERALVGIEGQQRASAALSQEMASFVSRTEETLAKSVGDAQEQMTARSRVSLDELTMAVKSATGDATQVYRSLVKELENAGDLLRAARVDTAETAQHLGQSAGAVREVTKHVNESMAALRGVSESLAKNVDAARSTVSEGASAVQGSMTIVRQQQQFVEDLSSRWPQLTRDYLEASSQAFERVAEAWKRHVATIEGSVGRISNGFNDSASEFAAAVEELGGHVQALNRATQGGATVRIRP